MERHSLSDREWAMLKDDLPGKEGDAGQTAADNRLFVNAVLWIARTGAPWRDLPTRFGKWNSVYQRFNRWSRQGVWKRLMAVLQDEDIEWLMLDSTVVRAHQHAAGALKKGGQSYRETQNKPWVAHAEDLEPSCTSA
jgi:transposase